MRIFGWLNAWGRESTSGKAIELFQNTLTTFQLLNTNEFNDLSVLISKFGKRKTHKKVVRGYIIDGNKIQPKFLKTPFERLWRRPTLFEFSSYIALYLLNLIIQENILTLWAFDLQIGLMRNGTLLAEDSPAELLKLYCCSTLEDVFLLLSRKQGRNSQDVVADQNDADVPPQPQPQIENRRPNLVSLRNFLKITKN